MGQMDLVTNLWDNVVNKVCTHYLSSTFIGHTWHQSGLILESKGPRAIFQKKGGKGQNSWKFWPKCTQFENVLKKGSLMHATIACLKQLEYALPITFWAFHVSIRFTGSKKAIGSKKTAAGIYGWPDVNWAFFSE